VAHCSTRTVAEFASSVLGKRYKEAARDRCKRADLPEQDLHRLRIAGKKLRYTAEFFRSLYAKKPAAKFIEALSDVQDHLGSLNDAMVSQQLLLSWRAASPTAMTLRRRGMQAE